MNMVENLSDISLHYFALVRRVSTKFDLTLSQALILLYVPFDGITISDLSQKLGVDISTMTRNIQRIEKKQLITRAPNISDKRSIKLLLSKRGKSIADSVNESISQNIQKILDKYDFDTSNQIMNSLESLGWDLYLYRQNMG
tara:strand:- start:1048 stop:1473 length:426 start_codon:yes stop_codon:yes gene_type:complete